MKQLTALYWFHSLNSAAWSLIGIFMPVYFLTLGYSLVQALVYYIYASFATFAGFLLAGFCARRFGMKKTLVAYLPLLFAFLGSMYLLKASPIPLWIIAILCGVQTAFYFLPLNTLFALAADSERMGSDVGKLYALPQVSSLSGPLIGALVISLFGFPVLFLVTMGIYLASIIPFASIADHFPKIEFCPAKITELFTKYPRYALAQFVEFFQVSAESVVWPVFIFLAYRNIFSIGILGTLLGLGSAGFTFLVGRHADKADKKMILRAGAAAMAVIWLARYFYSGEIIYYILTVMAGFFGILIWVPFSAYIYGLSKKENTAEFMVFREFFIMVSRLCFFGMALYFAGDLKSIFAAAAAANLLFFAL